jgi:hypothetical protein
VTQFRFEFAREIERLKLAAQTPPIVTYNDDPVTM